MKYRSQFYLHKLNHERSTTTLKKKISAIMLMLALMLSAAIMDAQSSLPYAKVSESGAILLPVEKPLNGTYLIDMSAFHFSSDEEMIKFLSTRNSDLYALRARTAQREGVLILQTSNKPDWNLKKWNEYFISVGASNPLRK